MVVVTKPIKEANTRNSTQMTAKGLQTKPEQATGRIKGLMIGRSWKVGADSLNVILYRREVCKRTGEQRWRAHGYYSNVANALLALADQGVRDTELADLKVVCGKIDQLRKDILTQIGSIVNSRERTKT